MPRHMRQPSAQVRGDLEQWKLTTPLDLVVLLQLRDHSKVLQCSGVALDVAVGRQLPEETPHNLPAARLRQCVGEANVVGFCQRSNLLRHPLAQLDRKSTR